MASATNASIMRIRNEKTILSLIHREPISRVDIAKKTGLTKAAVTIITEDLIKRGIVREDKSDESVKVGRTPMLLRFCGDSVYFTGVNIKRTCISVGMCDLCGKVIFEETSDVAAPEKAFSAIWDSIRKNIEYHGIPKEKISVISVVTPGPVDTENGIILNPPNFRNWHGVNVFEEMAKYTDIPVMLSNVSSAWAVAENYFGSAKNSESFMTLINDEGIGAGIMLGGSLFKGSCEIGHISVKYDGERCECGNTGCLEKYASIPNILKGTKYKSWRECTRAKDERIINLEAEYLSAAIVTVSNIFNLDRTVLCGELAEDSDIFLRAVREKTFEKMILKKDFEIAAGAVRSLSLIACAIGIYNFLH